MSLEPTTLDEIDYWDLDLFVHGDPHAAWRVQREQAPVWWHDRPGGEPFWSVASYDVVKEVHGAPLVYSSEANGIMLRDQALLAPPRNELIERNKPMIHTDPPPCL